MLHLGTQWTADLYGCDPALLNDVDWVEASMLEAAREARATIVSSSFHRFSPQGVSGVVVIAESHIAVHTWPEHGYAALDLFSCGDRLLAEQAIHLLAQRFRSTRVETARRGRGDPLRLEAATSSVGSSPVLPEQVGE